MTASRSTLRSLFLVLAGLLPVCCRAHAFFGEAPRSVTLPSARPSGIAVNDRIWLTFYPAAAATDQDAPAVVLLHPLGSERPRAMHRFARSLSRRGIAGAVMELPYHMHRRPPGEKPARMFIGASVDRTVQALGQSASDVSTVVTWLGGQPGVDAGRIGTIGVSLGAIVAHLAMGQDERLTAGVALLGAGNLEDLARASLSLQVRRHRPGGFPGGEEAAALREVDPITYADRNRPRRVLMVQAARDLLMPPRDVLALWEALGRPPIRWVDTNHYALGLGASSVRRASAAFLQSVWNGVPPGEEAVPTLHVPTLKLGMLVGLDSGLTPALQWQAYALATRSDHLSLLHLDLGWSGRGPFLGLAATVNPFVDIGVARRLDGKAVRPYLSLHIVF